MPDDESSLVRPGDVIEVPDHAWWFGTGTLRMRVNEVSPAFWHGGAVRQEVVGATVRDDGVVLPVRVATVQVNAVRKIPNQRPRI